MSSIKVIVLILMMVVFIVAGCKSTSPPTQTDNEQVEEKYLPEKSTMPQSSSTSVPSNTPIPVPTNTSIHLSDKYPETALVQPSGLILDDDFAASDWIEYPKTKFGRNQEFFDLDDDTILNTASISYCNEKWEITRLKIFSFRERIYLFESIHQAAQFAEKLKGLTEMYASDNPWFDIETTAMNFGENSFWLLRAISPVAKYSYIILVEDEAVMISELHSTEKIPDEDILKLGANMLGAFERSQHP